MIRTIKANQYLIRMLIKRDYEQRYKGSVFGILWSLIVPILMLAIYTFVFSEVFQARWNVNITDKYQFAMTMFCGLSVFNVVGDVLNRSTTLISQNANYVKKVMFPLEMLPLVIVCTAMFSCFINLAILIAARLIIYRSISLTVTLLLPALIPLFLLSLGVGLFVSALSVYLKDIGSVISVIVTIMMYASPVFYSLSVVPERFRLFCLLNPLTYLIENVRRILIYGEFLDVRYLVISVCTGVLFFLIGRMVFFRSKAGFADVL